MIIERFKNLAKRQTSIDWIVQGLISSGEYTYLVGEAGVGKSILMIQLVDALQAGKPFLGMNCKQRNCLYIQVDTGRLEWEEQIKRIAPESEAWTAYVLPDNFLDIPRYIENIRKVVWADYDKDSELYRVFKGRRFEFIVFDVLNKLTAKDLNGKDSASYVLGKLNEITKRGEQEDAENIPYVLVHHPNKFQKRGATAGAGSGMFSGSAGQVLTLTGKQDEHTGLLVLEKSKVVGYKEFLLAKGEGGRWRIREDFSTRDYNFEDIHRNGHSKMSQEEIESILRSQN